MVVGKVPKMITFAYKKGRTCGSRISEEKVTASYFVWHLKTINSYQNNDMFPPHQSL